MRLAKLNRRQILFILITIGFVAFIFGNSLQPAAVSAKQSGSVLKLIQSFMDKLGFSVTVSHFLVRKSAHFLEYMVLGILLVVTLRMHTTKVISHIFKPLFVGLIVPVTDEFIQLFVTGRAGMVQDVVLDFSGVITGLLITLLIVIIRQHRKNSGHEEVQ